MQERARMLESAGIKEAAADWKAKPERRWSDGDTGGEAMR